MDFLKENAENRFASNTRNLKGNLVGLKQVKQVIKPLSDVKNILVDNLCIQSETLNKCTVEATTKTHEEEYGYDDDLCFYKDDTEDNYEDIIPRSLQLTKDHIRRLAMVFDQSDFKEPAILPDLPLEHISLKLYDDEELENRFKVDFDPSADIFEFETELISY